MDIQSDFYDVNEFARITKRTVSSINRSIGLKRIRAEKVFGKYLIPKRSFTVVIVKGMDF